MQLWIDADACPVVNLAISVAARHGIPVTLVCDDAHFMQREGARTITVSQGADSADLVLVNLLKPGDAVVTQDYGLAALCLARGAYPLDQNGRIYTNDNIDSLLGMRHVAAKVRRGGGRLKGPPKRTKEQDQWFEQALNELLSR
ncbi:MAG: YaiI/YqxD family protein [Clostridia bacterium]|nr:YaiI/YqxD family protein [Clostridia bacterium]